MKLRLSCWAENLPKQGLVMGARSPPDSFALVTLMMGGGAANNSKRPTVLGQTEVIRNSVNPDFTKTFLFDFELGQADAKFIISLYHASSSRTAIGSTVFDVPSILGSSSGGAAAKELKCGGIVAVRLEPVSESAAAEGTLSFQLRAVNLKNMDGLFNKSDPFFELQRARKHMDTGRKVWDVVYRSVEIDNDLNPVWDKVFMDLDSLVAADDRTATFRLVVLDYDKNGKHDMIGHAFLSINDLIDAVNDTALQEDVAKIDMSKAIQLKDGKGKETGKILVATAEVTGVENEPAAIPEQAPKETMSKVAELEDANDVSDEQEIVVAGSTDELELELSDYNDLQPTFVNYVNGGCQVRVITAIDATASNGNPNDAKSLHHFTQERNSYENAMFAICNILANYDSDQKYPVFGFGAKRDGKVSQCFPFGSQPEVDGVDGILKVYRETFRSGIVMAAPRDFSMVIREAGRDAKRHLEESQSYSILLVFTNGSPSDRGATVAALQEVDDAPLSVVIIGVGDDEKKGDSFSGTKKLEKENNAAGCRDKVRFVHYDSSLDNDALTKAALDHIPSQLETYFVSRSIYPQPEAEVEEIAVEPYNPASDVVVDIESNEAGDVTVAEVKPSSTEPENKNSAFSEAMRLGQDLHKKIKKNKQFGKIKRKLNRKAMGKAKQRVNKLLGSKIL